MINMKSENMLSWFLGALMICTFGESKSEINAPLLSPFSITARSDLGTTLASGTGLPLTKAASSPVTPPPSISRSTQSNWIPPCVQLQSGCVTKGSNSTRVALTSDTLNANSTPLSSAKPASNSPDWLPPCVKLQSGCVGTRGVNINLP